MPRSSVSRIAVIFALQSSQKKYTCRRGICRNTRNNTIISDVYNDQVPMSNSNTPYLRLQDRVIDALLRAFSPARRACARAEQLISLNADGEANEAERRELDAHLERCPACRAMENATLLVRADLRERPRAVLPEALAARLAATIQNEQRRERVEVLERETKRRIAVPRLRVAGGVAAALLVSLVTVNALHQSPQGGHSPHSFLPPAVNNTVNHTTLPVSNSEPNYIASVPRSHTPGNALPGASEPQPAKIASAEIGSQRHISDEASVPETPVVRHAAVQQPSRPVQVASARPTETGSFFLSHGQTLSTAISAHAKPFRTGINSTSRTITHVPGNEIASGTIRSGKGEDFHFPATAQPERPVVQVAASDVPSQPVQTSMQNNMNSVLRNLAGGTQRAQIRSTRATISLAAYPSNSSSPSNGANLVYAPANL